MIEYLIVWVLGYIAIGVGLLILIDEPGMKWRDKLIYIVWPIPVATFLISVIIVTIIWLYIEIKDYIKCRKL